MMRVKRICILCVVLMLFLLVLQTAFTAKYKPVKRRTSQPKAMVVQTFPVPLNKLANYKSLKKMTNAEFQQAYDVALKIAEPIVGWSREKQIMGITNYLRSLFVSGIVYTTSKSHYDKPYGYFVKGVASCAGCARAMRLRLNVLSIPYEHLNENKWDHQWCRVKVILDCGTVCHLSGELFSPNIDHSSGDISLIEKL